ncbi:hypothetical protein D9623_33620 (plasmid) [Azospirillum brasilense]|uniref:Phage tail terminator-like protein n=1 Tax=Azospirillum brasilense TaxID=192 RepID=A0A4D8QPM7_AZOBR|nr:MULTISPECIES: phage tail terminator-like protein [Azospirillum]MDW7555381.1 phage tail terminator-like protein [Azospirillum brasilense]MDW7595211.1 phage tail terminator-like protein [Azospirillum brasilense]MDW7630364.1 phage tail terminator-like protein [Azospirillum brasilense]MDX5949732.1 phage tail terminator-like protein [Azospirillum brasilense]OPH16863.1 hypothetical protein FE89_02585 [Azospirillum brasilense]
MASVIVYDAIRAKVEADWSGTPVSWPNEAFDPPPGDHWIALEFEGRLWSQESIGGGDPAEERWDENGSIWVHSIAPIGVGERTQRLNATNFINMFRGTEIGAIEFQDCEIAAGGADDDGAWWRITGRIDFVRK